VLFITDYDKIIETQKIIFPDLPQNTGEPVKKLLWINKHLAPDFLILKSGAQIFTVYIHLNGKIP